MFELNLSILAFSDYGTCFSILKLLTEIGEVKVLMGNAGKNVVKLQIGQILVEKSLTIKHLFLNPILVDLHWVAISIASLDKK